MPAKPIMWGGMPLLSAFGPVISDIEDPCLCCGCPDDCADFYERLAAVVVNYNGGRSVHLPCENWPPEGEPTHVWPGTGHDSSGTWLNGVTLDHYSGTGGCRLKFCEPDECSGPVESSYDCKGNDLVPCPYKVHVTAVHGGVSCAGEFMNVGFSGFSVDLKGAGVPNTGSTVPWPDPESGPSYYYICEGAYSCAEEWGGAPFGGSLGGVSTPGPHPICDGGGILDLNGLCYYGWGFGMADCDDLYEAEPDIVDVGSVAFLMG